MPADFKTSILATLSGFYQQTTLKMLLPTSLPLQENHQIVSTAPQRLPRASSSAGAQGLTLSSTSLSKPPASAPTTCPIPPAAHL